MGLISLIFKTDKKTDAATLIGQTSNTSIGNVTAIAKKATGETPTGVTVKDGIKTVVTATKFIDFVEKDAYSASDIPR